MLAKLYAYLLIPFVSVHTTPEERWLSKATDLSDLERRQRMIQRGEVTF